MGNGHFTTKMVVSNKGNKMKPTKSIYILLSLFLTFSCDENPITSLICGEGTTNVDGVCTLVCDEGLTNVDGECTIETPPIEDMMSLDWILLMKGKDVNFNWYVESCDGYVEYNYNEGYDEYVGFECRCINWDNECGECRLNTKTIRVNSCDGYEICDNVEEEFGWFNILSPNECCFEFDDYPIVKDDDDGNILHLHNYNHNQMFHMMEYKKV